MWYKWCHTSRTTRKVTNTDSISIFCILILFSSSSFILYASSRLFFFSVFLSCKINSLHFILFVPISFILILILFIASNLHPSYFHLFFICVFSSSFLFNHILFYISRSVSDCVDIMRTVPKGIKKITFISCTKVLHYYLPYKSLTLSSPTTFLKFVYQLLRFFMLLLSVPEIILNVFLFQFFILLLFILPLSLISGD